MPGRGWWLAALVLAAGCDGITPPDRTGGYVFRHTTGIVFHWPAARLPVRYWVPPDGGQAAEWIQAGIATWRAQLLYGEFDGVLVADSAAADVVVAVRPPTPPTGAVTDAAVEPGACRGVTTFTVTDDFTRLAGPFVLELNWDGRFTDDAIVNCLYRVALHEVGHTLGIFAHSPEPGDLMAPVPLVRDPTLNDRRTVEALYHTPPDVGPFGATRVVP